MQPMLLDHAADHADAPARRTGLYTYLVRPIGPVAVVSAPGASDELTMTASLARRDGSERRHVVVVRDTAAQPDLVRRTADLLRRGVAVRLVVRFERAPSTDRDGGTAVRVRAVADALLEPARAASATQLDLFA